MGCRNHVLAVLRDVAMATNFGTKIACVNDSDYAIGYGGGLSGRATKCRYCQYLHLRDVAMTTAFWLSMGNNFSCMIANDTLRGLL